MSKYLTTCKNVGFDVLELSSGFLSIPTEDWASLVELTAAQGLKPKPEIGIQCVHPSFGLLGLCLTTYLSSQMGRRR